MKFLHSVYARIILLVLLFVLVLTFPVKAETINSVTSLDGEENGELNEIIDRIDYLQSTMLDDEYKTAVLDFMKYIAYNQYSRDEKNFIHDEFLSCLQNMTVSVNGIDSISQNVVVTLSYNGVSQNAISCNSVSSGDLSKLETIGTNIQNGIIVLIIVCTMHAAITNSGKVMDYLRW